MPGIGEIVPDNGPFRDPFWGGHGTSGPAWRQITHTNHTSDELQILSSLYMPRHDFATAVKGATSEELCDRVGCAFPIYLVQGVRSAGLQLAPLIYA